LLHSISFFHFTSYSFFSFLISLAFFFSKDIQHVSTMVLQTQMSHVFRLYVTCIQKCLFYKVRFDFFLHSNTVQKRIYITDNIVYCKKCRLSIFRHCLLFFSVILWLVGALTLLCVVIACSAVHCKAYAAGLSPLACLCMWVGYFLFHCAWGSHLLDQPEEEETTRSPSAKIQSSAHIPTALEIEEQEELENSPALATNDSTMVGYWKFVEEEPWQIKCSRDELR
ncbi:hypothetical protein T07_1364, partial [Trichinella nelsoni]